LQVIFLKYQKGIVKMRKADSQQKIPAFSLNLLRLPQTR